jgi:ADP-heptose:LPS heptosyltransferase
LRGLERTRLGTLIASPKELRQLLTGADATWRLLIKRSVGLGNVLMLLPVLESVKSANPALRLTLLTTPAIAPLLSEVAFLEAVEVDPSAAENYDWLLDLDATTLSPELAEEGERVHKRDVFAELFGLAPDDVEASLRLQLPERPESAALDALPTEPYLVLAGEATHRFRTLPDGLLEALARYAKEAQLPLVAVGQKPAPALEAVTDLRGKTSLLELAWIIAGARLIVGADSGVVHLAGALGTPLAAIFGGIDPRLRLQYYDNWLALQAALPCAPCNKHEERCDFRLDCLTRLTARAVWEAILTQWKAPCARGVISLQLEGEGAATAGEAP